ncbi:hypothetical protein O6H91_16G008600 [Diphasiastrum complanatum]|uniref:Uncharacterized protein n=1 Tax=Diphasiastrum complanatum TaxID=34168 RepID=A0ACC2BAQ1_DIPCM|nr:hypothetical protein O6H91_16G008600 [Diphasiastrum complanatum]
MDGERERDGVEQFVIILLSVANFCVARAILCTILSILSMASWFCCSFIIIMIYLILCCTPIWLDPCMCSLQSFSFFNLCFLACDHVFFFSRSLIVSLMSN